MAAQTGLNGSVVYTTGSTVSVVGIGEWSIDLGMSTVETTAFGDTWKQRLPSIREVSGSFSGIADTVTTQTFLQNTMLGGSAIALRLYDGTSTYWTIATAYLTGNSNSISIDGKGERSWDFDGHGAPTYT